MFDALESEIERRLSQTRDILISLNKLSNDDEYSSFLKIQKGLLFVSFYASIEFTVTNTVARFLGGVSKSMLKKSRLNFKKIKKSKKL